MKRISSLPPSQKGNPSAPILQRSATVNTSSFSRIEHRELLARKKTEISEKSSRSSPMHSSSPEDVSYASTCRLNRNSLLQSNSLLSEELKNPVLKEESPSNSANIRSSSPQRISSAEPVISMQNSNKSPKVPVKSEFVSVQTQTSFSDSCSGFTPTEVLSEESPLQRIYSRSQPSVATLSRNPSWIVITSPTAPDNSDHPLQEVSSEMANTRLDILSLNRKTAMGRSLSVRSSKRARSPSPESVIKKVVSMTSGSSPTSSKSTTKPDRSRPVSPSDKGVQAFFPIESCPESSSSSSDNSRSPSPDNTRARSASPVNIPATLVRIRSKSVSPPPVNFPRAKIGSDNRCSVCRKFNCPFMVSATMDFAKQNIKTANKKRTSAPKKIKLARRRRDTTMRLRKRSSDYSKLNIARKKLKLFDAVKAGRLEMVKKLIQDTGPTIRRVKTRATLLHVAASSNQPDVARFLLTLISPNIVSKEGHTPAHEAALKGSLQVLKILEEDEEFNGNNRDLNGRTYKDLLVLPLLKAVMTTDKPCIGELLRIGADPDCQVGNLNDIHDFDTSTPRQVAATMGLDDLVANMPKRKQEKLLKLNVTSHLPQLFDATRLPKYKTLHLVMSPPSRCIQEPFNYRMDTDPQGFVCFLNYSSFRNRPDLTIKGTNQDTCNLSTVLGELGYTGDAFSSLTLDETREVLMHIMNMELLGKIGCLIFVVTSHGVNGKNFLTSDLKPLDINWMLNLFKNSRCPQMRDKPKLFLFNLNNQDLPELHSRGNGKPKPRRLEECLKDTACIYANSRKALTSPISEHGSAFIIAMCRTLANHHDKEINEIYRFLLTESMKTSSYILPEFWSYGFSQRFFFRASGTLSNKPFLGYDFVPIGLVPNKLKGKVTKK